MAHRLLMWRIPSEALPRPGDDSAGVFLLDTSSEGPVTAATVEGWTPVSHTVTVDLDGPLLTVLYTDGL